MQNLVEVLRTINEKFATRGIHAETFNHHHIGIDFSHTDITRDEINSLLSELNGIRIASGWEEEYVLTNLPKKLQNFITTPPIEM